MRNLVLFLVVLTLAVISAASATVVLDEGWETGGTGWTVYGSSAPYASIVTDNAATGTHSMRTADNSTTNYTNAMSYTLGAETGENWTMTWNFYDTGATREVMQIDSYRGLGIGAAADLQQLIALGSYNSGVATTVYNYRVASGEGAGWKNTTITRTNNTWHAMKVEQIYVGGSTATINVYVDNVLGATFDTNAVYGVTALRAGGGLTNGGHGAYYDDLLLTVPTVPEPSSMLAFATGFIGLFGIIRRKKA